MPKVRMPLHECLHIQTQDMKANTRVYHLRRVPITKEVPT